MEVHTTADVEAYAAAVTPYLEAEPCARNVLRSIIELARSDRLIRGGPASFWWITDGSVVVAAASLTPPFPLLVSSLPDGAAAPLAEAVRVRMRGVGSDVAGVNGPRAGAEAFAAVWTVATGEPHRERARMLLHELDHAVEVPCPAGHARPAQSGDVDLLAEWWEAFAVELGLPEAGGDLLRIAGAAIAAGEFDVWMDDERPVSMVGHRGPFAGVVRIGPVYTPVPQRTRGYARRLTYEVSAAALSRPDVRRCMLYTDAANPVSNSIYRQAGYAPVGEHVEIRFERP